MALKTINSFQLTPEWRYGGSAGKLRLYYSDNFVDNESRPVVGGAVGSSGFYREVDITIASLVATVASFVLVTTEDSDHPNAKVTGVLYDSSGVRRDTLFEWSVPPNGTIASPTTFAVMGAYNDRNHLINPPEFYLTQQQILAFINAALAAIGVTPATSLALGIVKLSIAAADPASPSVWGTNDPLVRDALKLMGVSLDALVATPADGNVLGFSTASGTYKPLATATPSLHAASHQDGGTDEMVLTGMAGLLATPQIPVAHAVLHENGGADEISVSGLSGVLADAQTPAAHATSHISGGADPFTSAQLLEAVIKRIQTSTGPTDLTVGAVADGEFLKRVGATVVSGVPTGTGYSAVEDEGTPLTARSTLNFTGAGVTATDAGGKTVVDIPGGGSGSSSFAGVEKFGNH